jgi:hypothetical protein
MAPLRGMWIVPFGGAQMLWECSVCLFRPCHIKWFIIFKIAPRVAGWLEL